MGRLAVGAIALCLAGCASAPYVPDRPPPTWAELERLMAQTPDRGLPAPTTEPTLHVWPRFGFEGGSIYVICYVPEALGAGHIAFGLDGHFASGPMAILRIEHRRRVDHLACGTWAATCDVWTGGRHRHLTAPVLVKGRCADDGAGGAGSSSPKTHQFPQ